MDIAEIQNEIATLEAQGRAANERFAKLMAGLADGSSTVDEACQAFRESGNIQLDACELKIRAVANTIQSVGLGSFMNSLSLPTIG